MGGGGRGRGEGKGEKKGGAKKRRPTRHPPCCALPPARATATEGGGIPRGPRGSRGDRVGGGGARGSGHSRHRSDDMRTLLHNPRLGFPGQPGRAPFFLRSGFPFFTVDMTMSPQQPMGSLFRRAPKALTEMMYRFFASVLSAQFMTAPTGRARVIRNLFPAVPEPRLAAIPLGGPWQLGRTRKGRWRRSQFPPPPPSLSHRTLCHNDYAAPSDNAIVLASLHCNQF